MRVAPAITVSDDQRRVLQQWARGRSTPARLVLRAKSWLNVIERWFRELTQKRLRRGSFRGVRAVQKAIVEYVEEHNEHAKGLKWTALPADILAKVRRARAILDKTPSE